MDIFYLNAFYAGGGVMVYGEGLPAGPGLPGPAFDYLAGGLDIVAHELAHGVTEYSSDLVYEGESGALNESFSDMMATGVEFFFQRPGRAPAGRLLARRRRHPPGGIRSMADPALFGDPDHYSRRYTGPLDSGGVHINSSSRTTCSSSPSRAASTAPPASPCRAWAARAASRSRRRCTARSLCMMPARATFATARAATLQSARDLYGPGSAPERALAQAWTAVGVP